jgi:hypothetical protein
MEVSVSRWPILAASLGGAYSREHVREHCDLYIHVACEHSLFVNISHMQHWWRTCSRLYAGSKITIGFLQPDPFVEPNPLAIHLTMSSPEGREGCP